LTTGCLAELLYRAAAEVRTQRSLTTEAYAAWGTALDSMNRVRNSSQLVTNTRDLAQALASTGDGVLLRIRYHTVNAGLHMPEQLDKNSGEETSATDLTWSYATILKAMAKRNAAFGR
jgi:glucoamylase